MARRWRGWRWEKATPEQRLMLLAGVSSRFWEPMESPPRFIGFRFSGPREGDPDVVISSKAQAKAYRAYKDPEVLLQGDLVVIGSTDTDEKAFHCVIDLVREYITDSTSLYPVKIVNMGDIPELDETNYDGENIGRTWWREMDDAAVLIFHNILGEHLSDDRLQDLRDFLTKHTETTRFVLVSGMNPMEFLFDHLHMRPDASLLVTSGEKRQSR